ncbi:MAG: T9SS type A sorting domain-containing protein [Saprospiraceae bacterium]
MLGKIIFNKNYNSNEATIDLDKNSVPQGVYYIMINSGKNMIVNKLIKI